MSQLVTITQKNVSAEWRNQAEAKLAIRELKQHKKECGLEKREVTARQRIIREAYTAEVRARGSMVRGGGGFGRLVRGFQSFGRDSRRARLADDLAPLERRKAELDQLILAIDGLILQIERSLIAP